MIRAYRSREIAASERPLLEAGEPLMLRASHALARLAVEQLQQRGAVSGATVALLVGPGNNGGDALFAGVSLRRRGVQVTAYLLGEAHPEGIAAARRSGVALVTCPDDAGALEKLAQSIAQADLWIDGILGIGAHGPLRPRYAEFVAALEQARRARPVEPIVVAVDVPTGVCADDGTVGGPALRADLTVTMGAAKPGLLLDPGRRYVGRLEIIPLGFEEFLPSEPALISLGNSDIVDLWDFPGPDSHKYTRGVVGLMTGSVRYPGAALLSTDAALAGGAGMVRFAGPRELADRVVDAHPEIVTAPGDVHCWVIGSGLDLDEPRAATEAARRLHESIAVGYPVVLDAGALSLVAHTDVPSTVVLTPHAGELARLLAWRGEPLSPQEIQANPAKAARLAATLTGATVVLKGSVETIAAPDGPLYAQGGAPAWRATAGAGDTLAGLLGAMLAGWGEELAEQGEGRGIPARIGAAAAHLHGQAARIAAGPGRGRPIRASEISGNLPRAIGEALSS